MHTRSVRTYLTSGFITAIAVATVTFAIFPAMLRGVLSSQFLPHSFCYLNDKKLIALHVTTDTLIWLSYVGISCTLVYLVWRTRREIPFSWVFLAFGLFIVACGFTHFMEIVVLWQPLYWLSGDVKAITAVASVVTAVVLPGLVPRVHDMVIAAQLSENRREQLEKTNKELRHLSASVLSTQDAERRRVARDLHDGVGQYLASVKMSCSIALREREHPKTVEKALQDALTSLEECLTEVRTMSHLLHPPLLEEMGLDSAVPWLVRGFIERSGIQVALQKSSSGQRLPQEVEVALFRVLQESLTNIHRHSGSKVAEVTLNVDERSATLRVEDHGCGFVVSNGADGKSGVGITGMRERIHELGGELTIRSSPGGTVVEAVVPLEAALRPTGGKTREL